ncbi:SigE family RNA polymerase sigma factor [Actinomadura fibrosa]|uniref:SigE family RNA polymerase sigma factor n=1 Tax=Actinomadura fibrosa TaxID=111802 RepID=A0ABW2XLK8_9ACTN|nr:SigE family RNA polymerase sigma factor [Actinomadura fibrosa]
MPRSSGHGQECEPPGEHTRAGTEPTQAPADGSRAGTKSRQRRDDRSFVEFVTARGDALLRTASLLCGARQDAEDMLQTALEKAYRHWGRLDADVDPEPYVRRILVNLVISRSRRWNVLREIQMAWLPETPAVSANHAVELRGTLMDELRRLGPRQRAVLVLRFWEDLSEAETAKVLGCSVGTVKSQASRGLARLRERLDENLAPLGS